MKECYLVEKIIVGDLYFLLREYMNYIIKLIYLVFVFKLVFKYKSIIRNMKNTFFFMIF